ncbi:MAG TPA: hypothetical protein VHA12_01460 [Candidatus Nanoarchaeia archaeon]|nr:hypothetical protein [Candidatus Nanoarchaeia archaeon]
MERNEKKSKIEILLGKNEKPLNSVRALAEPFYLIRETYRYYKRNPENHDAKTRMITYVGVGLLEAQKITVESLLLYLISR